MNKQRLIVVSGIDRGAAAGMKDPVVKATLPAAVDLLERWFKYEGGIRDRTLAPETMKFLQSCGKLKPLNEARAEMDARTVAISTAGKEVLTK